MGQSRLVRNLLIVLSLVGTATLGMYLQQTPSNTKEVIVSQTHLNTPLMDYMQYQQMRLRLSNGLEALLISAPQSQRSGIAVAVGVGSADDPKEHMGLSHFCEHMVFLGSEKFPEEGGLGKFISKNSGSMNAYTAPNETVYGITCTAEAFPEATARMADMLRAPLFREDSYARELNAIDEEFKKNLNSDNFLSLLVLLAQTEPQHPLHKLLGGSKTTLAHTGKSELHNWIHSYYLASNMHVFAISSQPIEEMAATIEKEFDQLPKGRVQHAKWPELFSSSSTGQQIWVSTPSKRELVLTWSVPAFTSPTPSIQFLRRAICHPHSQGLHEILKDLGWIHDLDCFGLNLRGEYLFQLGLSLTIDGAQHIDEIQNLAFDYFDFLQSNPWPEVWLSQAQNSQAVHWQLHVTEPSLDACLHSASLLSSEPLETFPERAFWPTLESFQQAQRCLSLLSKERCIAVILAPNDQWPEHIKEAADATQAQLQDPWANTPYVKLPISSSPKLESLQWSIPKANPLLPVELPTFATVNESEYTCKEGLYNFGSIKLFPNTQQAASRDSLCLAWRTTNPVKLKSSFSQAEQNCFWSLFSFILQDKLQPLSVDAHEAGQSISVIPQYEGIEVYLSGYSGQAQDKLLLDIGSKVTKPTVSLTEFEISSRALKQTLQNNLTDGPLAQFRPLIAATLLQECVEKKHLLQALESMTFEQFTAYLNTLRESSWCADALIVSNRPLQHWQEILSSLHSPQANQVNSNSQIEKKSACAPIPFLKHWRPLQQTRWSFEHPRSEGNMVIYGWPLSELLSKEAIADYLNVQLLFPDFSQGAFYELRTQRQLGYVVNGSLVFIGSKPALGLLVLSSAYDIPAIEHAIKEYRESFENFLSKMTDEHFQKQKNRLLFELSEPSTNSDNQLGRLKFWCWDMGIEPAQREFIVQQAQTITKDDCLKSIRKILNQEPLVFTIEPKSKIEKKDNIN